MAELKKVAIDFYNITNIQIVLYDKNRIHLYSYPERHCAFCGAIRSNPELEKKCINCDNIGFNVCDKTRKPYIYKCHMNLFEAIAPIIENDIIIGYMMIGQILNNTSMNEVVKQTERVCEKYNLDLDRMLVELCDLRSVSHDFIYSAINMASMCACYLYYNKIIKNQIDVLTYQLTEYIENHLSEDLSLSGICKKFYISRSMLYNISTKAFGMGITDYIRLQRIKRAKSMLTQSNKTIYQIAEDIGFNDANYFVRLFKKIEGMTPGQYRKEN